MAFRISKVDSPRSPTNPPSSLLAEIFTQPQKSKKSVRNGSGIHFHFDDFRITNEQEEVGKLALQHEGHEWEPSITGELQKRRQRASQHISQYLDTIIKAGKWSKESYSGSSTLPPSRSISMPVSSILLPTRHHSREISDKVPFEV